jgi:Flp pilus assembly protein TadB
MTGNLAFTLACALILGVAAPFASAQSNSASNEANARSQSSDAPKAGAPNAKVRADIAKLVADAKAGKVAPRSSQFPQRQSNSLSKGAKIAIVAGIAVVVLAIIVVHSVNNIHCETRCVQ